MLTTTETEILVHHAMGGLKDTQGVPMAQHCLRVANQFPLGSVYWYVGALHDIIEDTNVDQEYLIESGYTPEIVDSVSLLTHVKKEMKYPEYIEKICKSGNDVAISVKIADQIDNLNPKRWVGMGRYRSQALQKKWAGVRQKLEVALIETRNARGEDIA